jgi:hypothetical protein
MGSGAVGYDDAPILNILVPHSGHLPSVAGRPFFIVICVASFISRLVLHLTQYAWGAAIRLALLSDRLGTPKAAATIATPYSQAGASFLC